MRLTSALQNLAQRQLRDYQARMPGTYFAEARPALALEDAYAVQMEVARLRSAIGDTVVGYMVGCHGPGIVEQFGMSGPIHARLFRSELRASGDALKCEHYANLAIEGEMAESKSMESALIPDRSGRRPAGPRKLCNGSGKICTALEYHLRLATLF